MVRVRVNGDFRGALVRRRTFVDLQGDALSARYERSPALSELSPIVIVDSYIVGCRYNTPSVWRTGTS